MLSSPDAGWRFDNSYATLPEMLFSKQDPVPIERPHLLFLNTALATELGLNAEILSGEYGAQVFAGNLIPEGAVPIAQAYAGHQFGHFTMLGDGRAVLLGEQMTPDQKRFDIQLKGSGQTPFSRRGDGRAALAPMLREYIISEAMHALGIPTTRSLAVVATGEPVLRETLLPGAVLTRVAASHIRVGTFQYAAALGDRALLKTLADYTIARHFPELKEQDKPYLAFFYAVMDHQIKLVVQWLMVGFIHGVMNTDNMAISGETIDYGPCAFMEAFDPNTVFSSIDHQGRYAYGNQPAIAQWNLARFAECLLPLFDEEPKRAVALAEEAIAAFGDRLKNDWLKGMRKKLGLFSEEESDQNLIQSLLEWMHANAIDFTNGFRSLSSEEPPYQDRVFLDWHRQWKARLSRNPKPLKSSLCLMRASNAAVIPRNHNVEAALKAASEEGDLKPAQRLLEALKDPYNENEANADYRTPATLTERVLETFCGT